MEKQSSISPLKGIDINKKSPLVGDFLLMYNHSLGLIYYILISLNNYYSYIYYMKIKKVISPLVPH